MKLSEYARRNGIIYRTAWEHFRKGLIPNARQLPTGTIVIDEQVAQSNKDEYTIVYSRVSSSQNKDNLQSQSKRLVDFCNAKGWGVDAVVSEIGSGLNDGRRKMLRILDEGKCTRLVVEHKDRLTRFGFRYIESLCRHIGCDLVVVNVVDDDKEDLIQDFVSVITSFCARIYGKRRSKRKTEKLIEELKE